MIKQMTAKRTIVVVGKESVGKTQLIASLTGCIAYSANFRGATVSCEFYEDRNFRFIDTPGILRDSDRLTTKLAVNAIAEEAQVLLVINGTHMDDDLSDMLPLVMNKKGCIVVTYWDKISARESISKKIKEIEHELGVPIIPVDARSLRVSQKELLRQAFSEAKEFIANDLKTKIDWTVEPSRNIFDVPFLGGALSLVFLFVPAWLAVTQANRFADAMHDNVGGAFKPLLDIVNQWPSPLKDILGQDYGFIAMFPFLILYALPTVIVFSVILAVYKASGFIDRLTVALHPLMRHFGLTGRDLVRVIMGFGCNVPAVISSRSCSSCTRGACVSAISFGSACSYQLPATIAVFAAAQMEYLTIPYLVILAVTTLIYLRLTVPAESRQAINKLMIVGRDFLQWPNFKTIWREAWGVVQQFFIMAFPIFLMICIFASLLQWVGFLDFLTVLLAPIMSIFNLPADASLSVILGSIRKDGIAIGLLDGNLNSLKVSLDTPVQVITVVYLAGVLLPCLVTLITVAKEMTMKFALRMLGRQVFAALFFAFVIAWGGRILSELL